MEVAFDDARWSEGKGAFGELPRSGFGLAASYPARYINTAWTNRELWMRRSFDLAGGPPVAPTLLIHHQGPVEAYLNGRLIYRSDRALPSYGLFPLEAETANLLRKDFTFINRESDLGLAGLREAKMRYHPVQMVEVYTVQRSAKTPLSRTPANW